MPLSNLTQDQPSSRLLTREFAALSIITFLSFCNIAIFFEFQHYLVEEIKVPEGSVGLLIGLFSLTGLVLRPLISLFLHGGNARKLIYFGAAGTLLSLFAYDLAKGVLDMAIVRVLHGGMYALLGTAVTTRLVGLIPQGKSGEGFSLFTVVTLLPYAVMPPLIPVLTRVLGGFLPELDLMALLMLFIFPVLYLGKPDPSRETREHQGYLTLGEVMEDLRDPHIWVLLFISLIVFATFGTLFYFLDGYADLIGISDPGLFFTISTAIEIGVRVFGGRYFDRVSKPYLFAVSLGGLGLCYLLLARTSATLSFYGLGIFFGLAWGLVMPLANSLIFDFSDPMFRPLNSNLGFEMYQAGLFAGPFAGNWVIMERGYSALYNGCGLLAFIAAFLSIGLIRKKVTL
jgi:predicted MFS family arabinose efflux permease